MKFAYAIPLLALTLTTGAAGAAHAAGLEKPLPAQVLAAPLYGARDTGRSAAGGRVDFSVILPYRNAAELPSLLRAQQNPSSTYYRRFLSAPQFRAYFSPSTVAYDVAARNLRKSGFQVTTFANRTVLHASGTATNAERFFNTRIDTVRQAGGRLAYANVAPATIPAALTGARVVGLSNVVVARTAVSDGLAAGKRTATSYGGTLFGPDGGYGPSAIVKAEDYPVEHGYRGGSSNVADLIDSPVTDSDVATYLKYFGVKRGGPRTTTITVDGGCGASCFDGLQATLDAESVLGAAPDASLFTYEITSLANGFIADGFNAIVSDDAVNVVNFSVGACEINGGDLQLAIEPIIAQGAAEGITFESVAFGGANLCQLGIALPMTPANLDTVTAVGASNQIVDNSGKLLAQSAFADSNGGVSVTVPLPSWQAATKGVDHKGRNVPDLVLPGAVDGVGPSIYYHGLWEGGFAFVNNAPFAGYLATVQQYYGYSTPLGNIAPGLYSVFDAHGYAGGSAAYFADITLGNIGTVNGTPVLAKTGYDLASGIGTIQHGYAVAKALGYTAAAAKR